MSKGNHVDELARELLVPGEELLCSARVNYNGAVPPNAIGLSQPPVGLEGEAAIPAPDPDATVAFPSAKQLGMALTGGRLLLWALGFSGKPKQYLGAVPLSAIREVHAGEITFGAVLRIVMKSGAAVDLEFLKGEPAEDFIGHIKALVAQP